MKQILQSFKNFHSWDEMGKLTMDTTQGVEVEVNIRFPQVPCVALDVFSCVEALNYKVDF